MKKSIAVLLVLLTAVGLLAGCAQGGTAAEFRADADFSTIIEQAKGTTVTFYGWGGDEQRNAWLDTEVAAALKEKYDITLERVPMDIDQILSKLVSDKEAKEDKGAIDMIWINGENFYSAKENGLLFGPFAEYLPNYKQYIDAAAEENMKDFGYPIQGYEAPYGKAQLVLIADTGRTPTLPHSTAEFLEFVKANPGKVTYPAPPDFTGSAFVRNVIYDIVGWEQFADMEADPETVRAAVKPAMDYLKQLNPYLWNQGKTFPATSTEADNMFADGEILLSMSYSPFSVGINIEKGIYPTTAQAFLFDSGMIGNTNYIAIAANAPNKAGAMVAINEIISAQMQASQYSQLKTLPVVDYDKLTNAEKALFDEVQMGAGTLAQDELLAKRLPETPAKLVPLIEQIWAEEVVGK
ncbi:MAG: ABC transporter substrate-binding protein [Bacillota bacterium]